MDLVVDEYRDKMALIDKQFNDEVDLLRQNIDSRLSSLRSQRDEQLIAAWINYIGLITPYLSKNDLFVLLKLEVLSASAGAHQHISSP
jgi:predicted HAD superfamily hydrolase